MAEMIIPCVVDGCAWQLDPNTVPGPPMSATDGTLDGMIRAMMMDHVKAIEAVLKSHLQTHTVLDYVQTITKMADQSTMLINKLEGELSDARTVLQAAPKANAANVAETRMRELKQIMEISQAQQRKIEAVRAIAEGRHSVVRRTDCSCEACRILAVLNV